MKKPIFVTLSIIVTILILGIWAYLFTFGTPKDGAEIFTNFGLGNNEGVSPVIVDSTTVDVSDATQEGAPQALKQLTLRPVAGATFTGNDDVVRYVEQGTGHIYSINLVSGAESLISGTTLPGTREALFAKDGAQVAISIFDGAELKTLVGSAGESATQSFTGVTLPKGAQNIYFDTATNTLMYTLKSETGISGYSYNTKKETGIQLFSIPLRDVTVLWGGESIHVYTTPTASQTGYLYKISKNELTYVAEGGRGLMGFVFNDAPIVTTSEETGIISSIVTSGIKTPLPVAVIPEKCVGDETFLYCAVPRDFGNMETFPDNWYKGVTSYSDTLWEIDIDNSIATVLSNFELESGRQIDVSKIGISEDNTRLYFINKNDNTLWMFDSRVLSGE
ncbi:MAG: hypothetical protein NUW00_02250 [Candidatus Kaiserbacteria bacterium]|nr:hypothetical protein [Candidatus Kaiserbacteria bacterium]